jgi:hypothetical protein
MSHQPPGLVKDHHQSQAEVAWKAAKRFRQLIPMYEAFARSITGRSDVRIQPGPITASTDGGRIISILPPFALGEDYRHDRTVCYKRDSDTGYMLCAACGLDEKINTDVFHEIAHVSEGTWDHKVWELPLTQVKPLHSRFRNLDPVQYEGIFMASALVDPKFQILLNGIEDVRIEHAMCETRPGLAVMMEADARRTLEIGFEKPDGTIVHWKDQPIDGQALIWAIYRGSRLPIHDGELNRDLVHKLDADAELVDLINQITRQKSVIENFLLTAQIWKRLISHGHFLVEEDFTPPPPPPAPDEPEGESSDSSEDAAPDETQEGGGGGLNKPGGKKGTESDEREPDESGSSESPSPGGDADSGKTPEADVPSEDVAESGEPDPGDSSSTVDDESRDDSGSDPSDAAPDTDSTDGGASSDPAPADSTESTDPADTADTTDSGESAPTGTGELDEQSEEGGADSSASTEEAESSGSSATESDDDGTGASPDSGTGSSAVPGTGSQTGEGSLPDGDDPDTDPTGPDSGHSTGVAGSGEITADGLDEPGQEDDRKASSLESDLTTGTDDPKANTPSPNDDALAANLDAPSATLDPDTDGTEPSLDEDTPSGPRTWEEWEQVHGGVDDLARAVEAINGHDEKSGAEEVDERVRTLINEAINKSEHLDNDSAHIKGVFEGKTDPNNSWSKFGFDFWAEGQLRNRVEPVDKPTINSATMRMRRAFEENRRARVEPNLKRGRVDSRVLGKRAPVGDGRVFGKKDVPSARDYAVVVGVDISGSTSGTTLANIKAAVDAQAELLASVKVTFSIVAHSAGGVKTMQADGSMVDQTQLLMFVVKDFDQPYDTGAKERLFNLPSTGYNLDGHAFEYMRKLLQKKKATDKLLIYYSDGAMPRSNYREELALMLHEIEELKRLGIKLTTVGVENDEPARKYGLDMTLYESHSDIIRVVDAIADALGQ